MSIAVRIIVRKLRGFRFTCLIPAQNYHLKFSMLTLLAIADRLVDLLNLLLLPAKISKSGKIR